MTANDNTKAEFDAIAASIFAETETPSLAGAVDALMQANAQLIARVEAYEANAKLVRHAFRDLRKATNRSAAEECMTTMRNNLRAIHPDTAV